MLELEEQPRPGNIALVHSAWVQSTESARRKREFTLLLCKGLLLGAIVLYCIGGFGKAYISGLSDFYRYFTNWSWTVEGIFYALVLVGFCLPPLWDFAIWLLFLPIYGLAWYVYIVLMAVVWSHPGLLKDVANMDQAVLAIGNEYYHTFPLILVLLFAGLFKADITYVYGKFLSRTPKWMRVIYILWSIYFPTFYMLIYMTLHDPMRVYGVQNLTFLEMFTLGLYINTFFSGLAFLYFFPYTPNPMHWLWSRTGATMNI